jgi:hypothetical protein
MPARPEIRRFTAWDVFVPPRVVRDRTGLELVGEKAIWAAADHFLELLADRCAGDALGLDEDVAGGQ